MGDCCWGRRWGLIEPKVLLEVDLGGTGDCWIYLLPQLLSHPGNERMVTLCGLCLPGLCKEFASESAIGLGLWKTLVFGMGKPLAILSLSHKTIPGGRGL